MREVIRVPRTQFFYAFAPDLQPVATVSPGATVTFETLDANSGRITRPEDFLTYVTDTTQANPATGPVAVAGALPGDTLAVTIQAIRLQGEGILRTAPWVDSLVAGAKAPWGRFLRVEGNVAILADRVRFPIRPMVGTLGVAPGEDTVSNFYSGNHGGNMDVNLVVPGATVYLPVRVPGAMLAMGDVHVSMGDGEITAGGANVCAEVDVRVQVERGQILPRPWIETASEWATYAAASSEEEAVRLATGDMGRLLVARLGIEPSDAALLIGACGDARLGHAFFWGEATAYVVCPRCTVG